jgi:opacity protein-like surface antigen
MKHRSNRGHSPAFARFCTIVAALLTFCASASDAQSRRWSLTGSAGTSFLNLSTVDDDNAADAQGWARQGYPISQFASLKQPLLYSLRLSYRYDREFAASLIVLYSSETVRASYHGSDADLDLSRGISSNDIIVGLAYYPAARPYFLEWYIHATLGLTMARATATAIGVHYVKVAGVPTPQPLIDTDAKFSKTKTSVGAGCGIDIPVVSRVAVNAEALYRFAQFGAMDGTVSRFGEQSDATTSIGFDYSGFLLSAGIRIEL